MVQNTLYISVLTLLIECRFDDLICIMKLLHLADLHIGKKVNEFCMLQEQEFVLKQALDLINEEKIETVLICGDVFDRPIPPLGALELFDWFLGEVSLLKIKTFIISGNHDSIDRLSYLSNLLEKNNIFIAKNYNGELQKISANDNVEIYLLPYISPMTVKKFHLNNEIKTYNDAIKCVIDETEINENKINIILAHQFVLGKKEDLTLSQSEQTNVGGIDEVSYENFLKFDYTALGHLHCPQECGCEKIYYSGSIVKYSFSEINQKKKFRIIDIKSKNEIIYKDIPIKSIHQMKEYRGYIDEFLDENFYSKIDTNDYIHFVLLDEYVLEAKKKLSLIYPNIMLLEFDNSFTKSLNQNYNFNQAKEKTLYEHFCDFYLQQTNDELNNSKAQIVKDILNSKGES